ncbi:MAG: CGNR zinc finger domain-containing protein [Actinobacteria bacterium]|nr:CGNR zinc finger domain-containing protein [Actinomycetota bacterium]MBI3686352.1 CGNR zinc finger domain-containing protein [Actinomycetota bacterium]
MAGVIPRTDPRPLAGEPMSIDLLNTVWNDAAGPRDLLDDVAGLTAWLTAVGLTATSSSSEATRLALRQARDAIRTNADQPGSPAAREALNRVLTHGSLVRTLTLDGPTTSVHVDDPAQHAAWVAAENFLHLLHRPDRIRRCAHPHCVLYFYDTSPKGNRRWCSMSGCGNRAKAARHYSRRRTAPRT